MRKRLLRSRLIEIRSKANELLNLVNYKRGFVDIGQCATALGAVVKYAPYDDGELAGMLIRKHNEKPLIAVNSSHHQNRRRFTIAHEIGHFMLHDRDVHIDEKLSIRRERNGISGLAISLEEIEANQFAAEILMPYNSIVKEIESIDLDVEDDSDIEVLARTYKVSTQAMSFRVSNLSSERFLR